jgi:hypothetical protein
MGVEIKLSDNELPVSPVFVDFLAHIIDNKDFEKAKWGDQLSEELSSDQKQVIEQAAANAQRVIASPEGQKYIARSYELLVALLTGNLEVIKDIQLRFHFINIIGAPRNGGSYLTKELYRSLGFDPDNVPNVIAHDGFPEAGPFRFEKGVNSWVSSLHTMAEFLSMVEIYFGDRKPHTGKIIVPKKLTKGSYAGGFFHQILGQSVEHFITIRNPVAACISTYEKSGGFPEDGRHAVRGNIEQWVVRDLVYTGLKEEEVMQMDYFDAYLRYWEQYHSYIASTGLSANRHIRIVTYVKENLMETARDFYYRFGDRNPKPEEFKVFDKKDRHPDWHAKAEPVIKRIHGMWNNVGMEFPIDEVMQCW